MKTVLVTGSNGFIGRKVIDKLISTGYSVHGITTSLDRNTPQANYIQVDPSNCDYKSIVLDVRPEIIINAAGSPSVGFSQQNKGLDDYLNFEIPHRLLSGFVELKTPSRFIQLSSAAVYGSPSNLPIYEDAECLPISNYGRSKRKVEVELESLTRKGYEVMNLRLFSVYGSGLRKQLFWDLFQKYVQASDKVRLFGTGNESRDFIHVKDVVNIILLCCSCKLSGQLHYNVCTGRETKISEAAHQFLSNLSKNVSMQFSNEIKEGDPVNWCGSPDRLLEYYKEEFVDLKKGLKEYTKWLESTDHFA